MNRAENVPIATLSGIASLTEIVCELPLPCSSSSTKEPSLSANLQQANEANQVICQPFQDQKQLDQLTALLGSVNNAYLDFKNSAYNRPSCFNEVEQLPITLQQVFNTRPAVFQPHFDEYHGSPLKKNSMSHIAYSPNQRNAFLWHQHVQQQQPQSSPFLQGTQFSSSAASSSPLKSPHVQQFFKANNIPSQSPQISYNNLSSPKFTSHQAAPAKERQTQPASEHLQPKPQPTAQQQPPPLIHHGNLQQNIPHDQAQAHPAPENTLFSPLKTRGQRYSTDNAQGQMQTVLPQLNKPEDVRKNLLQDKGFNESPNIDTSKLHEHTKAKKHHKKKRKSKDLRHEGITQDGLEIQKQNHGENHQNDLIQQLHDKSPKLELRVPKLIVRKVKKLEGNSEVETLEVFSPDKNKQICQIQTTPVIEDENLEPTVNKIQEIPATTKPKRARSKASSVSSVESAKPRKRKKLMQQVVSTDDDDDEDYNEEVVDKNDSMHAVKKFKYNEDDNQVEGVEVKNVVKKFVFIMDKILDRELELEADGCLEFHEDMEIPPETLLPRPMIASLCSELAKMKSCGLLNEIPTDQLVRLMAVMDRHVLDTISLMINKDTIEEEGKKWYHIQAERVIRSADAATAILHITTTPNMPKQVFLEEAIEHVTMLCQFHLENTIYPEFDPIYKIPSDLKDSTCLPKSKRSKSTASSNKSVLHIYNKFCEVVSLLGDLIAVESLTDSIILKMSQIGIAPFFVEQVNVLQLEALKVARTIFRHYVKHRDLILDDILASLTRLPSNKRNLRSYRLKEDVSIQMFTALVLQLVQCTVQIPDIDTSGSQGDSLVDKDVLIVKSYEDALRAARQFMSTFLKKCSSNSRDENDFRPLFENFLHDLFTTANLPEWPAAEVLLTQLGRLFVVTFSNAKIDMTLRSSALDYLAQITTHLRKFALKHEVDSEQEKLKLIIQKLAPDSEDIPIVEDMEVYDDRIRKALLLYLHSFSSNDPSFRYAREFYLGQWIRDIQIEIEKSMIAPMLSIPGAATKVDADSEENDAEEQNKTDLSAEKMQVLQEKKDFYHQLVKQKTVSHLKSSQRLTYEDSCIVINYLASTRSFSQSFDIYMNQIFKMLSEQAIGLRTKAVKALTMIVGVDSNILARDDVQNSVHGRLLDPSTNVREAAVDLIGQFILKCPNLIKQYYDMIIARILDTGVSVRKRVIKILRDICIEHPELDKIPEICSKMIRRVDDELGIKKLVTEVFRTMWFLPVTGRNKDDVLYQKALNITKVVTLCKDTGFDWLESLLNNLLDPENHTPQSGTVQACQQLVDCLFQRLLKPEHNTDTTTIVSCLITLYIFCKSHPILLVPHAVALQPFLSSKVNSATDMQVLQHVSKILELVVPLLEHPNPKFLAELEEDTMKLILKQSQTVVLSCTSCLAAIINKVTHNYKFVVDGFSKLYKFLGYYKREFTKKPDNPSLKPMKPTLLRALFTAALFCRYFDLDKETIEKNEKPSVPISEQLFDICMFFTDFKDEDITVKALVAIGSIGIRHPQFLLRDDCKKLYQEILSPDATSSVKFKFTLMKGLQNHLTSEENRLQEAEKTTGKKKKKATTLDKNIKEFGDSLSGTTSEIVQFFLTDIMKSFFTSEKQVRISALQVVSLVLRQGLVHPAQCIPYLIAISTDTEQMCHIRAEQCLNDLDSRYQGFVHMKGLHGVKMAYQLQTVIQKNDGQYLCGYRETENKISLINHVYGLVRSNKQYRRPFLLSIIKLFDDKKSKVDLLYFLTENLAYLSYQTPEEPLFVLHHIDTSVSVKGANILQSFKELFHPRRRKGGKSPANYDSDDDDEEVHIKEDSDVDQKELLKLVRQSFGCVLLLELKHYLKMVFGFTDSKCQKYSPSEPSKLYDKALNRKYDTDFTTEYKDFIFSTSFEYDALVDHYVKFKNLMMTLDTEDSDSEAEDSPEKVDDRKLTAQPEHVVLPNELTGNDSSGTPVAEKPDTAIPTGIIPQRMDSTTSLPGLNINIPVIPAHVYETYDVKKPQRRNSRSSRRSSRSSRNSVNG